MLVNIQQANFGIVTNSFRKARQQKVPENVLYLDTIRPKTIEYPKGL